MNGLDVFGASPQRAILLKVKNVGALVAKQGGAPGQIVSSLSQMVPGGIVSQPLETLVLDKMVAELRTNLAAKGVDAEVSVVEPGSYRGSASGLAQGTALGAAGVGLLWLAKRLLAPNLF